MAEKDQKNFIIKVYGILTAQLMVTTLLCSVSAISEAYRQFTQDYIGLLILCIVAVLVIEITLFCCVNVARKVPTNYILLMLFTACESYIVSFISSAYEPRSVLACACMTFVLTLALSIFACVAKTDWTVC